MTETEWQNCTEPNEMLAFLGPRVTMRKMRLFACACCNRIRRLFPNEQCAIAIDAAEKRADGLISNDEFSRIGRQTERMPGLLDALNRLDPLPIAVEEIAMMAAWALVAVHSSSRDSPNQTIQDLDLLACAACWCCDAKFAEEDYDAYYAAMVDSWNADEQFQFVTSVQEQEQQTNLIRDIFGNPLRPVTIDPAWLTSNVTAIAQTIYNERRFEDLPILADAVEDAGCRNDEILKHCRGSGAHVRGCWVVDLFLGKE